MFAGGGFEACFGVAGGGLEGIAGAWAAVHRRALAGLEKRGGALAPPAPWRAWDGDGDGVG